MYRFLFLDNSILPLQPYMDYLQDRDCSCDFASSCAEAFSLISEHPYDLILLETSLWNLSGFDLCAAIGSKTDIPVIFFSNQTDESSQIHGFSSGACDYIPKGISPELFWIRLYVRISSHQHQDQTLRTYPPLVMDLQRQRAFIHKTNLRLTQIEFSLLALLSSRPKSIFSVEELYTEIWGTSSSPDPQIVQAHLSRMRRKMEKAFPRHDFIETVWRKGYQFIPFHGTEPIH